MRDTNNAHPLVRYLYHGSSGTQPPAIYESTDGFNMNFAGANGAMWGRANYFAAESAYSDQYRSTLTDGNF